MAKKMNPSIVLSTNIVSIVVVVKVEPYYEAEDEMGIMKRKVLKEKEFVFPRKLKMTFPLHLNYDGYLYDNVNSINALIAKNINAIAGEAKQHALAQYIKPLDGIEFIIMDIDSLKESESEIVAEWVAV